MSDDYNQRLQRVVNQVSERRMAAQRTAMAYGGGLNTGTDTKRFGKAWRDYGFPNTLSFRDYLNLYQRHSLAHGIVHRITEKSWQDEPWVVQGDADADADAETPWQRDLRTLFKRLNLWQRFEDADRRRLVGSYAALILQVADDLEWSQEMHAGELVGVIPAWQGQISPVEWDNDTRSATYGMVTTWSYQEADVTTADNPPPGRSVNIHHSRVVLVGDYREGVPLLEAAYNDFISLEKVLGALGESYWKNAARQISVEYDKETDPRTMAEAAGVDVNDLHEALNGAFTDLNQGLDAGMVSFGGKATPLVANVPNPKDPFAVLAQSICASAMIPMKIVVGSQTGERASTEDQQDFAQRCQARRTGQLMLDVRRLIDRLMDYGIIEQVPEYHVMWSDLAEASLSDRLANLKTAADSVKALVGTGLVQEGAIITADELRTMAGLPPMAEVEEFDE